MSELSKPEEDLQDPGEAQGPVEAHLLGAEAGEALSPQPCPHSLLLHHSGGLAPGSS